MIMNFKGIIVFIYVNTYRQWMRIHVKELERISQIKEEIEECKSRLKKRHVGLIVGQEKFIKGLREYKSSTNKPHQKY